MASEQNASSDIIADSEDEFLKTMPDIKVAGTSECPPTDSQLAASSDTDDELIFIKDFETKDKWNALARKRYDMVSRSNQSNVKKVDFENIQNEIRPLNSTVEEITVKKTKINEILAEIESTNSKKRSGRKGNLATNSEIELDRKNYDTRSRRHSTRVHRDRLARESSSFIENSPELDMDIVKCNSEKSFSKKNDESNSDSDNSTKLFPTYTPSKPIDIRAMLHEKIKDEDDSDEEFVQLRKKCEKMIHVQNTYAIQKPPILKQTVKSKQKASPKNARIAQKRALNNSNSLNITRSNSDIKHEKSSPKARTVDKDASVLQVSSDSSMKQTTATSRMPNLTIIRNKRSMAPDVDDEQAQPTKRTKTTASNGRPKLQELSATDITSPTKKEKRSTRAPKTLDGYVLLQKSKDTKTDSLDMSAIGICVLDDKKDSSIKPTRVGSRTRGKAAASNKKMIDSTIASNNSSKENVIVEDSDIESTPPKPKTRRGNSTRNQTDTDASVVKDSSTENEEVKTRGRGTRRNKKKSETTNQANKSNQKTIIQDSDSENVKIAESVNRRIKNTRSKAVQSSDSGDYGKIKNTSNRSLRNKDSTLDDSENKLKSKDNLSGKIKNISSRSQRNKVSTLDDSENELKSKEKSVVENLKSEELKTAQTRAMRNRKGPMNKGVNLEKSQTSNTKQNKSIRNKTRDTSSDSVFSESGDDNKQKNAYSTIKGKSFSSAKQTRKLPATTTVSIIEKSSEESQEVAEILKNNEVKEAGNSGLRRGRTTKKSTVSISEYTDNSEGTNSNSDEVFEKPVSRPKRARLYKSVKNRSTSEHDSDEKKDIKSEHSQHHLSVFTRKNTPSPTRFRRSISVSPMKRSMHKVLFTGEKSEVYRRIVKKLGGSEVEDIAHCSILVADIVRRTFKFLCCLARGIPIVSINWLDDSNKASHFLDWEDYILQDRNAEANFKFKLKESLEKAKKHKLLEGYTVLLTSRIKSPPMPELKEMITSSGGKPIVRAPTKWPEKTVVVTIKEDLQSAKKLIAKAPKSIPVCSTEFILTGLLRQEVNLQEFKL